MRKIVLTLFLNKRRRTASLARKIQLLTVRTDYTDVAESATQRIALYQTLNRLPPRQKAVTILKFVEQLSFNEIAEAMDISPATALSLCHRGLKNMRITIGEQSE